MCDPVSIAFAAAAVGGAVIAKSQQSKQNDALEYNAQIDEQNAQINMLQAQDALNRGAVTEYGIRRDVKKFIGSQRVAQAASGVDVNSGSTVEAQADSAGLGEVDAMTARQNAQREAWAYRNQAQGNLNQAGMSRAGKASPWLAFGSSILGSGANLAGSYAIAGAARKG